ncbi:cation diffusion facilitator family transporter [Phreatobacter sp. HK31-P]
MVSIKQKAALASILVTVVLTAAKGAVGLASGSIAILAEAAHGLVDTAATLLTFYAVRLADKPADDDHQYGHGKVESIAALAETAFLFLVSGIVVTEAVRRLAGGGHAVEVTPLMAGLMVAVIAIDYWRVRVMRRVAEETGSHALESGALHFAADMASSIVVLAGLLFVWLGFPKADAIAAIVVAILICVMSWQLGRRTIDTLMDRAPKGATPAVSEAVAGVPGVVEVESIRLREVGTDTLAEVIVKVNRTLPLERVAEIKSAIAAAAATAHAGTVTTVTTEPVALDDETVMERVHLTARRHALAVHHVTVQHLGEQLCVGLDLEVDGALTLGEAHEIASRLETAIRGELGADVEVETHIEPLQVEMLIGSDAEPSRVADVAASLAALAAETGPITDVHSVRVRETGQGVVVTYHCRADPSLTVEAVHEAVDEIERRFRRIHARVIRVVGHTEPPRALS